MPARRSPTCPTSDKDDVLKGLESGDVKLEGADGKAFFEQALKDIQMGFFADPIYGGNRDMVGVEDDRLSPAPATIISTGSIATTSAFRCRPSSITGRAEWTPKG